MDKAIFVYLAMNQLEYMKRLHIQNYQKIDFICFSLLLASLYYHEIKCAGKIVICSLAFLMDCISEVSFPLAVYNFHS